MLGEQKVNRLAVFVHGALEVVPRAFDLDVGRIPPPAHPHRLRAPMARFCQGGTVLDDPALESGVINLSPALFHQGFDRPIAQGRRDLPAHTQQEDILGDMGPRAAHRHGGSPAL